MRKNFHFAEPLLLLFAEGHRCVSFGDCHFFDRIERGETVNMV